MKDTEQNEFEITRGMYIAVRFLAFALGLLMLFFVGRAAITFCLGLFADGDHLVQFPGQESPIVSVQDIDTKPKPVYIDPSQLVEVSRADITVAGDLMLHLPIVRSGEVNGGYNFDDIFTFVKPYISAADYAVANLETTLSGIDGKEYTGFPNFNSPDQIAQSAKNTGFDMLLTGNNHCYDYGTEGLTRTLDTLNSHMLDALGTVENSANPRHVVRNLSGIKVGMACYTFADMDENGNVTINGMTTDRAAMGLVNAFDYDKLSQFYTEVEGEIASMRANGADTIILYIHWGDDYSTSVSDNQKAMAQKLCDLGVDVIAGSHPHVIQPIDLLTSSVDPEHKTICLYSMGNFLSNQRADNIGLTTGHSEDGVLFTFALTKYNDGSVRVSAINLLPTWVLVQGSDNNRDFYILPLNQTVTDWKSAYNLSDDELSGAKNSYNRTMALVTPGLNKVVSYLSEKNAVLDPNLGVG